jgi:hypothetical protein
MKTYTWYEVDGLTIYVDEENGKVHHAVDHNSENPTTLYPYEPSKFGGADNVCGFYTLKQVKDKLKNGKISFK